MKNILAFACLVALLLVPLRRADGAIPGIINYQGRVTVDGVNFQGSGQFRFALVDDVNAGATTTFWSNDGSSANGNAPTAAVTLAVNRGLYSVALGDLALANMTVAIPASVFQNSDVRLRVWFDDGVHGVQLLTPDQRLVTTPYAFQAQVAQQVPAGAIGPAQLASGAVTVGAIAAGAVGTLQLAPGAVTLAQLGVSTAPSPGQVLGSDGAGFHWTNTSVLDPVARGFDGEVWLAVRTDGRPGTGTADDPFDAGTARKLDNILQSLPANRTIHFGPGLFRTQGSGYQLRAGLSAVGTGPNAVITTTGPHGIATGQRIRLEGLVGGSPVLQGAHYIATVLSPTTFSIPETVITAPAILPASFPFVYRSWKMRPGWKIKGSGIDATIVQLQDVGTNEHYVFGGDAYNQTDGVEIEDLTIDVNAAGQTIKGNCSAACIFGSHCHLRRLRGINWAAGNPSLETFVFFIGGIPANIYGIPVTDCVESSIRQCIIGPPALGQNFVQSVSAVSIGGQTPSAGGVARDCLIEENYATDIACGGFQQPFIFAAFSISGSSGCTIRGNIARNLTGSGSTAIYWDTYGAENLSIADNRLSNVAHGINVVTESSITGLRIERNVISIQDLAGAFGIQLANNTLGLHAGAVIRENHILPASTSVQALSGLVLYKQTGLVVENNRIETLAPLQRALVSTTSTISAWSGNRTGSGAAILPLDNYNAYAVHTGLAATLMPTAAESLGIFLPKTHAAPGATAVQTIAKPSGSIRLAPGDTSKLLNNSLASPASVVLATLCTLDATCKSIRVVKGPGTLTFYPDAPPTAEIEIDFLLIN